MGFLVFILVVCVVFIGGGWLLGTSIGSVIDEKRNFKEEERPTYIDNSVNLHTHHHVHSHKNLTVIDEETHRKGLDHFSDKKENRDE